MSTTRPMTAEDLEQIAEFDCRLELVRGVLLRRPFNNFEQSRIAGLLSYEINRYAKPQGLGFASFGCGYVLARNPDTVRAPRVAFLTAEHFPQGDARQHFVQMAPDLAVEICSLWEGREVLLALADEYLTAGTRVFWLIDPMERLAVVLTDGGEVRTIDRGDTLDGGEVECGLRLSLASILRDS